MKTFVFSVAFAAMLIACGKSDPGAEPAAQGSAQGAAAAPPQDHVECKQVAVTHKKEWGPSGIAGAAVGGAAGGLVGNQFGGGSGKTALTAAGAVGGAVGGHELAKGNDTTVSYQEHCTHTSD